MFAMVFKYFSGIFHNFLGVCFKVFHLSLHMLQVMYLDVSKINRMLHLHPRFLLSRLGVSSSRCRLGIRHPLSLFLDASDVRGGMGPRGR
jgi:hypothetical protein